MSKALRPVLKQFEEYKSLGLSPRDAISKLYAKAPIEFQKADKKPSSHWINIVNKLNADLKKVSDWNRIMKG